MRNQPKTVIVTGASQGIGSGLVKAFLERDYLVVANSRKIEKSGTFAPSEKLALVDGLSGSSGQVAAPYATGSSGSDAVEQDPATRPPAASPLAAASIGTGRRRRQRVPATAPTVEPETSA